MADLGVLLISFQILSVNEGVYSLLEVLCPDGELELYEQLLHQQLVTQAFSCLHNAHNSSVNLQRKEPQLDSKF